MQRAKQTRFLAFILALVMVVGLTPISAYATETENDVQETTTVASEEMVEDTVETEDSTEAEETVDVDVTDDPAETEETVEAETTEDSIDVDAMSDGELLAYVNSLSDEEANTFFASLTEAQQERLLSIMESVEACSTDFVSETHTVFKHTESTLAPGVEQYINYAYSSDGKQMVYYVAVADISRDDVIVQTSYKEQYDNGLGMAKLTEQIAYANGKYTNSEDENYISDYYTVVAGVNGSFYNMTTGQPSGYTVIDGESFGTTSSTYPFFAILTDGTAVIDYPANASNYVDEDGNSTVWQAIAGSQWLVRDGEDVTASATGDYNTDRHSRTCVGITADGKVVFMVLDGRQEPFSCGGSMHELAQIMLEAGCVAAINLDGGGSTTYAARQEGSDSVEVINNPSDGSERSISAGLMIASLTIPSDTFDHVNMTAEDEYVTPGTSTEITIAGVSPAGSAAAIPDDVTYEVTNGTYENGVLTATAEGDVILTAYYDGDAVGSVTVHAVMPDALTFDSAAITVPFGKTVTIGLTATYGLNEVKIKADDVDFELSNDAIGTMNGFDFTAGNDENVITSTITATIVGTEISAQSTINLGKGSELIYDFEDGEVGNWQLKAWTSTPEVKTNVSIVTEETGMVRSGDYALALELDYSGVAGGGYYMAALYFPEDLHFENATRIGMWVHLPDDFVGLWARYCAYSGEYDASNAKTNRINGGTFDVTHYDSTATGYAYLIEESGWYYFSLDVSSYSDVYLWSEARCIEFYTSDRDGTDFGYTYVTGSTQVNTSTYGRYTLYIDDFIVDYSSAVDDREAPVFGDVSVFGAGESSTVVKRNTQDLAYQEIAEFNENTLTISAAVSEDTTYSNATGLNTSSAQCYVDGYAVDCKYTNGNILLENHTFTNGYHTIRFVIEDNAGNSRSCVRKIYVNGSATNPTLSMVPADPDADRILLGSLYWVNLETEDLADVQSVTVNIDLNSVSDWELEGMEVASGFTATYEYVGSENGAVITFVRNGEDIEEGATVLASLPVRAYYRDGGYNMDSATSLDPRDIRLEIDSGKMVMTNGDVITFTSDRIRVDTQAYGTYAVMSANSDWHGTTHVHTVTELDDKDATCTECGYTDRTYCEVCSSVIEWGESIEATGHTYDFNDDGMLTCDCGKTYTGEWTDGKLYVDGVATADGWVGDSYYVDGVKVTGVQCIDGVYYDFGDDGVSQGTYNGLITDDYGIFAVRLGSPISGWFTTEDEDVYYMGKLHDGIYYAMSGEVELGEPLVSYLFDENCVLIRGGWYDDDGGRSYYWAGARVKNKLVEVLGETYFINRTGYAVTGVQNVATGYYDDACYYVFDNETYARAYVETGLVTCNGNTYGYLNGVLCKGFVQIESYYYYFSVNTYAMRTGDYVVGAANSNGLLEENRAFTFDTTYGYAVDENGDPLTSLGTDTAPDDSDDNSTSEGFVTENGNTYYYFSDGTKASGLQNIDGKYYYFSVNDYSMRTGYYIVCSYNSNGLLDENRAFTFDATYGYAVDENGDPLTSLGTDTDPDDSDDNSTSEGFVTENGNTYYYFSDGTKATGLQKIDGKYYYFSVNDYSMRTGYYIVCSYNSNGLLEENRAFTFDTTYGYAVDENGDALTSLE